MLTLQQLLDNTPNDIASRSREVTTSIGNIKLIKKRGVDGVVFEIKSRAVTESTYWSQIIELYPPEVTDGIYMKPSLFNPAWVSCTCPFFMFHCEYALSKVGSSDIINIKKNKTGSLKTMKPLVTNPREIPYLCKHLYKASPEVVRKVIKIAQSQDQYKFSKK